MKGQVIRMKKVNFFKVEVKYSGKFEDYTKQDFMKMARANMDRGVDPFDHTKELQDDLADAIDCRIIIDNYYPCNKLAQVTWAEVEEGDEE